MPYIAGVEVDQRQNFIQQADTLREMVGASRMIEYSVQIAEEELKGSTAVKLFWPVSGVLRFYAEDAAKLGAFLTWYCRQLENVSLSASVGLMKCSANFDDDLRDLDRRVRKRKDAKSAALALPSLPFFAPCSILPHLPANHWSLSGTAQRKLRSWQAKVREEFRNQFRNQPIFGLRIPQGELPELDDLAPQESDSFIGLLKGDLDGLGKLLASLRFVDLAKVPELRGSLRRDLPPAAAAADVFCRALEGVVKLSILEAYEHVYPPSKRKWGETWPFLHLIVAGDDVLILSRRDLALELAFQIGIRFAGNVENDAVVQAALRSAGIADQPTISFGVLFMKVGYPFDASFDLAEELLHSAKKGRSESPKDLIGGFMDYHWLGDSARPGLAATRNSQQYYRDDSDKPMWLTTRPWGISKLDQYIGSARDFRLLPRRKIKQLDEISRLGKELSDLAFQGWWSRLREEEKRAVNDALARIAWEETNATHPAFWREVTRRDEMGNNQTGFETCFLDLVEVTEVLGQ